VPRGLPEAFILGENFLDDDSATLILGDNIFEGDFSEDIKNFKTGGKVFATKVSDPERSGVVEFDDKGKVLQIVEKPEKWISDYAVTGLYVYDHRVVKAAKEAKPSGRKELEIVDLHNYYLTKSELEVKTFTGEWLDAGTFDSLLVAGQVVKDKKIYENFDPIINEAIQEFNEQLKMLSKKMLK